MLFDSILGNIVGVVVALVTITIAYFKWRYQFWKRHNVPYFEPTIPFGTSIPPFSKRKIGAGLLAKQHYEEMKAKGWKHGGLFTWLTPTYFVTDLDYVRNILTKDFQHFVDRGMYVNEKDDPLSGHLFNIEGQKWRNMRMKLSPTFTSGKMKMMFNTLLECVPSFLVKIESDRVNKNPIDIKEVLGCLTTDIIGSCAFGLECNSFKEENAPFRENGRKFFDFTKSRLIKSMISSNFPAVGKFLGFGITPPDVTEFFMKVVEDTVKYRESNNIVRKDFMQLLIDIKNNKLVGEEGVKQDGTTLTMRELAAQSFVFFVAGFETSSTTMTFAMYELARQPEIQERLREEINIVLAKHGGKVTYDAIQEMKYMDTVINETLRMYPPVPVLFRKCVKDYKVPDQDVVIKKGVKILIPILGIHYDNDHYPNPEKFDPERFNDVNKSKRHNYAHLPFGEGPRNCIGKLESLLVDRF